MMELMRTYLLLLQFRAITLAKTVAATMRLRGEPKSAAVGSPPPQAITPALTRLNPMSITTIPLTKGVIIRRKYLNE